MRIVKRVAAVLIPVCAAAAVLVWSEPPPGDPPVDIKTEEGLRKTLDVLETRYEAVCRKMGEATWKAATGGSAGPGSPDSRAEAQRDFAAILAEPKLEEVLGYWMRRRTATTDPTLMRRVMMWNRARDVAAVTLDPGITELESDLAARIESYRFTLDGKPVTRDDLRGILASEPDPAARRKAWAALASVAGQVQADVRRLVRMRAVKARSGKYRYFHDLIYRAQDLDPYWVFRMMELLTARTNGAWAQLLYSLKTAVNQTDLQPWDLEFAMAQRAKQKGLSRIAEAALKEEGAIHAARKLLEALGFDPSKVPLRTEIRPLAAGALWVPLIIPSDLRFIVSREPGPLGAAAFYETVLRGHGRALQAAFNRHEAPMLKGYPWIPGALNGVYAEGMAGALGEFTRDPLFLSKILGLSSADTVLYLELEKERRLLRFRRLLLAMGMEFTLYVNPDADLDGRYSELAVKALGVEMIGSDAALWTADPMVVTRPVQYQDQVLALSVSAGLHEKLRATFGEHRLESGKVASWLIERCYARGEMGTLQERLAGSIEGGLDFDALLLSMGGEPLAGAR